MRLRLAAEEAGSLLVQIGHMEGALSKALRCHDLVDRLPADNVAGLRRHMSKVKERCLVAQAELRLEDRPEPNSTRRLEDIVGQ
jgi:hypothetical protein